MRYCNNIILFGNIYVALGAVSLIQSTCIQLHFANSLFYYSVFVFFSTLFIYNLQRIFYKQTENKSYNSIRRTWVFENQTTIKLLTLVGFVGMGISFFFNDFRILFYLSPLFILSLAYFIPVVKLRKNAWFKLITLVVVWTMTTAIVPQLLNGFLINTAFIIHALTRFCFMLAICIPFDIRDMGIDKAENVSTLPLQYGEKTTRNLALICIILYIVFIVTENFTSVISLSVLSGLLLSTTATLFFIAFCNSKRSEYYFVAGIDGTMILQGAILIVGSLFQ